MNLKCSSPTLTALAAAIALVLVAPSASAAGHLNLSGLESEPTHDQFIVKYRKGSEAHGNSAALRRSLEAAARGIAASGGRALSVQSLRRLAVGAEVVKAGRALSHAEAEALMRKLAADPQVEYVELDQRLYPVLTPNDTRYTDQWHYYEATASIKANEAWDKSTGSGIVVAVIDTGITPHSDLDGNIVAGYDFVSDSTAARDGNGRDSNPNDEGDWFNAGECGQQQGRNSSWHGTHVAGTVGAVTNNSKGVAGVAYGGKVMPVRVLAKCGGTTSDISDAIIWASGGSVSGVPANNNPAEILNLSLGGGGSCSNTSQAAVNGAVQRGTTVVVAAGNSNQDVSGFNPANCNNVIAVAAIDRQGKRSVWSSSQQSNYGNGIDVAAPGSDILSTVNAGTQGQGSESYSSWGGTSMASPHVAGVAALMQAAASSPKTPAQIETLLKDTLRAFPQTPDRTIGAGMVNAKAAVDAAAGTTPPPPSGDTLTNGTPVTGLSGATGSNKNWTMAVPAGATGLKFVTSGGTGDADLYVKFGSAPTTTSYDCRSEGSTNAETCNITTAQTGTYHVLVYGYSAYSGMSLTGSYSTGGGGGVQTYANDADYAIEDNATVESPVTVSGRSGNAPSNATVTVNIVHTYRGDLRIDLIAPDGSAYLLKNYSSSDSADNVNATYTVNLSSEALNGTWKLRVNDNAANDIGYINSWSVKF